MFAAAFAHELRTPLAVLKGRLHGLQDGVIDPATGECGRLLAQVNKLLHVVDSLGTLTNARSGGLCMDWRTGDLAGIVVSAMDEVRPEAEAGGIELRVSSSPVMACFDPARLTRALAALARAIISDLPAGSHFDVQLIAGPDKAALLLSFPSRAQEPDAAAVPLRTLISRSGPKGGSLWASLDAALATVLLDAHGWAATVGPDPAGKGTAVIVQVPLRY
mgnify:CR=1 FL=1